MSDPVLDAAMAKRTQAPSVFHVTGPIVIDWGNGVRIQLAPASVAQTQAPSGARRAGRPASPATQALRSAMQADAQASAPRSREAYLKMLHDAGGPKSRNAAGIIVNREAKRFFGGPLGRPKRASRSASGKRKGAGRGPSLVTAQLRAQLAEDKAKDGLRDAKHYIRWLVDKAGIGLKRARPVVYRELRAIK